MIQNVRNFSVVFSVVIFISIVFALPGPAGAYGEHQGRLPPCTFTTGPLTSGISSTNFPYGNLYKVGTSFICLETGIAKETGIGDFNNDGRNDIVMTWNDPADSFNYNVSIAYQDAQGKLSTSPTVKWIGKHATLAVGDLNHDGLDDFAVANAMGDDYDYSNARVRVFIQQPNGNWIMTPYFSVYGPDAVAIGDVNNDGWDDIVVSSWGIVPNYIGVYIQTQDGFSDNFIAYPSINAGYDDIAIGDVNNDGLSDVVKMNGQGTTSDLLVYLQNAEGQLNEYIAYSLGSISGYRGTSLAIGDVTGDERSDVVVSYSPDWGYSHLAVFVQDNNGTLSPPVSYLSWSGQTQVELADINFDGRQDVVTAHRGWQNVGTYIQLPNGTLDIETLYPANYSYVSGISLGDLNNDNLIDIFVADTFGFDVLYREPIFSDLPINYWASGFINRLYRAGVTAGCSTNPVKYCPDYYVNRAQMAVFLLRGEYGASFVPDDAQGNIFDDVPANHWAAAWIETLFEEGITGGCGSGNYCPGKIVTRDQMAVFLLRAKHGQDYTPPPAKGVFADVPANYWAAAWIEQLAAERITGGCGGENYCPITPVTRAQMAVFLARTFNLP